MIKLSLLISSLFIILSAYPQNATYYSEDNSIGFNLPDPLLFENGESVNNSVEWEQRKLEIISLFENEIYGKRPLDNVKVKGEIVSTETILNNQAIVNIVKLSLSQNGKDVEFPIKIYLPKRSSPVSVFIGYRLHGTDTITLDSILSRGYGVVDIINDHVDTDVNDGFKSGVNQLFPVERNNASAGTIAIWAWGLSRAMDYLQTDERIDKVFVIGHSRAGKTALWAGANDSRFSMVVSNNSGCVGAALSKRKFGETVEIINTAFPHWFCDNFKKYNNNEALLPVDQHQLIALIAPRPVYVASAEEDNWSDPRGEFLSCLHASPVYELLGFEGLPIKNMPAINTPVFGSIAYHIRSGKHDLTRYDWIKYMDFADRHFGKP